MNLINLVLVVFLCNLAPIFAPPTWSILVYFLITHEINPAEAVILGAISAGLGRFLLAHATRALRNYIPIKARKNLFDAGKVFEENKGRRYGLFALFILSPLPSAQLFEAAGLLSLNLKRLAFAFFCGRLITYSIYGYGAAALKQSSWGEIVSSTLKSPWGIALQVLMLFGIYLLTRINWKAKVQDLNNGNHSA